LPPDVLKLKCTKFDFGWAPPQTPLGEEGTYSKSEGEGRGKGKGKRREKGEGGILRSCNWKNPAPDPIAGGRRLTAPPQEPHPLWASGFALHRARP